MLDALFITVLNMSLTAGYSVIFVLIARLILKKAPRIYSYVLWAVILFRLVCPFSFESAVSLLPTGEPPIPQDIMLSPQPHVNTGIETVDRIVNSSLPSPAPYMSANPLQIWCFIGRTLWLTGLALLLLYSFVSLMRFRRRLRDAIWEKDHIFVCPGLETAFVLGIFRPKIYLPSGLSDTERSYILLHERTHIRRCDHMIRMVSFLVLCIHWFNPLVWLSFYLSGRDMEMSCDEAVIRKAGSGIKKGYSSSLLSLSTGGRLFRGTPPAFGEGDTGNRVKNILRYKKPAIGVAALAAFVVFAAALGLLTGPEKKQMPPEAENPAWNNRTRFVGNNSAVGNLIFALTFPQNLEYSGFSLRTDEPPYGLTVNFTTDTRTRDYYTGALNQEPFQANAVLLFSLIENVDEITFTLDDGQNPYSESFTREWAQDLMGEDDLFSRTGTLEDFLILSDEISVKVGNSMENIRKYQTPPEQILTFFVKPDESPEVIGKTAAEVYLKSFLDSQVSDEHRISDYTLVSVQVIEGEPKAGTDRADMEYQYVVRMTYDIETAAPGYLSAVDDISGKGAFTGLYRELCVKEAEHGNFEIIRALTGGGEKEFLPPAYSASLTPEELAETEALAREQFDTDYDGGAVSVKVMPDDSPQYANTGIEDRYSAGNIILYEVLTARGREEGNPPFTVSVARTDKNASWEIINWGY